MEFEKAKSKGYTTIHDTPLLLLMRKVKDRISDVSKLCLAFDISTFILLHNTVPFYLVGNAAITACLLLEYINIILIQNSSCCI